VPGLGQQWPWESRRSRKRSYVRSVWHLGGAAEINETANLWTDPLSILVQIFLEKDLQCSSYLAELSTVFMKKSRVLTIFRKLESQEKVPLIIFRKLES
jgi:hypothetical protein